MSSIRIASGKSCSRCKHAANFCKSALLARYLHETLHVYPARLCLARADKVSHSVTGKVIPGREQGQNKEQLYLICTLENAGSVLDTPSGSKGGCCSNFAFWHTIYTVLPLAARLCAKWNRAEDFPLHRGNFVKSQSLTGGLGHSPDPCVPCSHLSCDETNVDRACALDL